MKGGIPDRSVPGVHGARDAALRAAAEAPGRAAAAAGRLRTRGTPTWVARPRPPAPHRRPATRRLCHQSCRHRKVAAFAMNFLEPHFLEMVVYN